MKVAVVGIGGVGGYYGGKLAARFPQGGEHEVIFFCRGTHLETIRRDGLRLITREGSFIAHPSMATDSADDMGVVDVAFFAVKGYSLADVAKAVRPTIGPSTVVIPLGNGVDNDEVLANELKTGRVLNGCVHIATYIKAPGVVEQTGGSGKLFFGDPGGLMEPYLQIETMLKEADIDGTLSAHILRDVWTKFIFIDAISAVTSLHAVTIGTVLSTPELKALLTDLMSEVEALAAHLDAGLPEDIIQQSLDRAAAFPPDTKTSMQRDVEKKARTELETMMGYVVRKGKSTGVPTPRHDGVYERLRTITT